MSDRHPGQRLQRLQDIAHRHRLVSADVIDLTTGAFVEQKLVGANRIPHICEGAHTVEIADPYGPGLPVQLDLRDLSRERAFREDIAPTRSGMGEHPRPDQIEPIR